VPEFSGRLAAPAPFAPPACASAKVLERANAVASAIVVIFITVSSLVFVRGKPTRLISCSIKLDSTPGIFACLNAGFPGYKETMSITRAASGLPRPVVSKITVGWAGTLRMRYSMLQLFSAQQGNRPIF
jgi:hypothetical protein